jgi:hypothetical protein
MTMRRPSASFLIICALLALIVAVVAWLSGVGGCEDLGSECHRGMGVVSVIAIVVAGLLLASAVAPKAPLSANTASPGSRGCGTS